MPAIEGLWPCGLLEKLSSSYEAVYSDQAVWLTSPSPSTGPLTTVWEVYKSGYLSKSINPPIWIILIGAFGLVSFESLPHH